MLLQRYVFVLYKYIHIDSFPAHPQNPSLRIPKSTLVHATHFRTLASGKEQAYVGRLE